MRQSLIFMLLITITIPGVCSTALDSAEAEYQTGKKLQAENKPSEAAKHFFIALQQFKKTGEKEGMAKSYSKLGSVFFKLVMNQNAVIFYNEAARIYLRMDKQEKFANCMFNMGKAYYKLAEYD